MKKVIVTLLLYNSAMASIAEMVEPKVLELALGGPSLNLEIKQKDTKIAEYSVNSGGRIGLGLGNDFYGFRVSTHAPPDEKSIVEKGETKYTDYQFRFILFKNNSLELIHQKYSGYFLKRSNSSSALETIRPDINTAVSKVQYTYVFAPDRFNLDHLLNRVAYKAASGGSWVLSSGLGNFQFIADAALADISTASDLGQLRSLEANNIELGGGYGFHLATQPYFVGGLIRLAVGQQQRSILLDDGTSRSESGQTINSGVIFSCGLDYKEWFSSFTLQAKLTEFHFTNQYSLSFVTTSVGLVLGFRI